ncbi:MAG: hypothetical protein JHD16_16910 [Solirubrobacteraceae bacterium]|nr:hypothetical protein [Solirubrobacteraceae bacterium]
MSVPDSGASSQLRGAYGLALNSGVFPPGRLNRMGAGAERWSVTRQLLDGASDPHGTAPVGDVPVLGDSEVDEHGAHVMVAGTRLVLDRASQTATIHARADVSGERLVHPCLAPLAIAAAHWAGRVPLHASAVIVGDRAWAILAERGDGKTTTVAALAQAGHGVLTDDLLVVDDELQAHAGPRCVDLRRESTSLFPGAVRVDDYPTRERFRLTPGPVPPTVPLAGFIRLLWSEHRLGLTPIPAHDRLPLIGAAISMGGPLANPRLALDLAALPVYALERPQGLDSLSASVDAIAGLAET